MNATVKLLNGELIHLTVEYNKNNTNDSNEIVRKALSDMNPVLFPYDFLHIEHIQHIQNNQDTFLAFVSTYPTEVLIHRTSTAMYFGLDIFNAYCCELSIENNVDMKRLEHDMYAVDGGVRTVSLKYIDRFVCVHDPRPNILAIRRKDNKYGASLFCNGNEELVYGGIREWHDTIEQALSDLFSCDLSTEGIKAYDVNSGERIYGGVELSFVLTREEIERLVHICSGHI